MTAARDPLAKALDEWCISNDPPDVFRAILARHGLAVRPIAETPAAIMERAAQIAETARLPMREVKGGPMAGWQTFAHEWPETIAAAIRAAAQEAPQSDA